jgi:hypothetical protein
VGLKHNSENYHLGDKKSQLTLAPPLSKEAICLSCHLKTHAIVKAAGVVKKCSMYGNQI